MKSNKFIFLLSLPFALFGESSCEDEKYFHYNYSTPGMHLLNDAINIKYSSRKDGNPNYRYVNAIRSNIERDLLNSARRQVRQHLEQQRITSLNQQRAFSKESILASAWENSSTGIVSGISWWSLSNSEKQKYRAKYIGYYQTRSSSQPQSNKPSLEKEISMAWARSKTGQNDGRSWSKIPEDEKKYYRNNYIARKENGLLPNNSTMIAQAEYKEAWLMLKNHGSVNKYWHQLTSVEKSRFRKDYTVMMNHQDGLLALK